MGWPNLLHFWAKVGDTRDADNNWQNRRDVRAQVRLFSCHGQLHGTTVLHRKWKKCVQSKQSGIFVQVQRLQKCGGMYEIVQRVKRNSRRLHILFQILLFWGQLQRKRDCKQRLVLLIEQMSRRKKNNRLVCPIYYKNTYGGSLVPLPCNWSFARWRHLTKTTRMHFAATYFMQNCVAHKWCFTGEKIPNTIASHKAFWYL